MQRGSLRLACAGLGLLVSTGREPTDLHSGLSGRRTGIEWAPSTALPFPDRGKRHRGKHLLGRAPCRWPCDILAAGVGSNFGVVLSDKGWIGFSKSPHSNAQFSGEISFDGVKSSGDALGFGVQGHNCGYRHRTYWRWMHAYFPHAQGAASTVEALVYDMPLGLIFRKAIWWHMTRQQF